MGLETREEKLKLRFLQLLCKPSILYSCILQRAFFPHTTYCKSAQLHLAMLNVKHAKVHKVCILSVESYLKQTMPVAMLAKPHSTAWGELHLGRVYHPLINSAKKQEKKDEEKSNYDLITTQIQKGFSFCAGLERGTDPTQLNRKVNPTEYVSLLLPIHPLPFIESRQCKATAALLKHDSKSRPTVLKHGIDIRTWNVGWINRPTPDTDTNRLWHYQSKHPQCHSAPFIPSSKVGLQMPVGCNGPL